MPIAPFAGEVDEYGNDNCRSRNEARLLPRKI